MNMVTIDRSVVQQALEAMLNFPDDISDEMFESIVALRAALAQQAEAQDALRAALAQQDESDSYGYASRLAVAIWEKHYKDTAPQWKPLDYLIGVLTQIDNMTSGLTRLAQQEEPVQEPVQEPVAWLIEYDNSEREVRFVAGTRGITQTPLYAAAPTAEPVAWMTDRKEMYFDKDDAFRYSDIIIKPLYLAPPQRQPLTEEEIVDAVREADLDWQKGWTLDETQSNRFVTLARAIERAHGIGEQP